MPVAQRGQPEGAVVARILFVADSDIGRFQQAHHNRQNAVAGMRRRGKPQPRPRRRNDEGCDSRTRIAITNHSAFRIAIRETGAAAVARDTDVVVAGIAQRRCPGPLGTWRQAVERRPRLARSTPLPGESGHHSRPSCRKQRATQSPSGKSCKLKCIEAAAVPRNGLCMSSAVNLSTVCGLNEHWGDGRS